MSIDLNDSLLILWTSASVSGLLTINDKKIHVGSGTWHKRILVAKYTSEKIYFLKINEVFMAQEDDTLSGTDTHNSFNKHKQRILITSITLHISDEFDNNHTITIQDTLGFRCSDSFGVRIQ